METWKDIKDYEGFYQVSNLGNVKSLKRNTAHERILKPKVDKGGYLCVNLTKNGIVKTYKIHRLVGLTFIPNPKNKYSINHINGNKTDNRVENLEWATYKEQVVHAVKMGLWKWSDERKNGLRDTLKKRGKLVTKHKNVHGKGHEFGCVQVIQKDDDGNIVKIWDSMSDASRDIGVPVSHIVRVCKGVRKHARGFVWEYCKGGGLLGKDTRKL